MHSGAAFQSYPLDAVPGPLQPGSEARQRGLQEVRRGSSAASPGTARVPFCGHGPRAEVPGIIFDSIFQFKQEN